eukprot:TRINITY_DN3110_c0_g1_i1.p1 TRINITY_DN3110_c0_g1~~TRINITY_DN3110_c0_g1_i1.p1  ORF type:complete len:459 (+),score=101.67 TRINITY_DN3110_c0_g1_i1:141-1517(+)
MIRRPPRSTLSSSSAASDVYKRQIPSLPLSAQDAAPLLEGLTGHFHPDWLHRSGPGPLEVELVVNNSQRVGEIWNVLGEIRGEIEPDRVVVVGNHRDAWVGGAVDPSSGSSVLLELARGLGSLMRSGWRPRRTILLASWDAEEYGLVGSTEFVEEHMMGLSARAVAYLNVDIAVGGVPAVFHPRAVPSLAPLLRAAAATVQDPADDSSSTLTAWAAALGQQPESVAVGALGSGSDYSGFLQHAGVSSVDLRFASHDVNHYAVYHSMYDSVKWMETYGDPDFKYHKALTQIWGWVALELADSVVLPFNHVEYADELARYASNIKNNTALNPHPSLTAVLDWTYFDGAIEQFRVAALNIAEAAGGYKNDGPPSELRLRELNDRLMLVERAFIVPEGLPGRAWFKHAVFSPSLHNSYGSEKFPSLSDAVAEADWKAVERQMNLISERIQFAASALDMQCAL